MASSRALEGDAVAREPAIADFLAALQTEQGVSRNTVAAYRRDLCDLATRLRREGRSLTSASPEDIIDWMDALRRGGRKPSTVGRPLPGGGGVSSVIWARRARSAGIPPSTSSAPACPARCRRPSPLKPPRR